ncbi:MAG: response regulator [Vicinamibacteria bacterium]|jgi:DNA-binding response OmpR family regulator|nr:response regulator [Vicinamibacteria bacterium]
MDENRMKVLLMVAEGDQNSEVFRSFVDAGFEVIAVTEGARAIEQIDTFQPDLVILDLVIPSVDRWGVLKYIQKLAQPPRVIVSTNLATETGQAPGREAGVTAFVMKPMGSGDLLSICQRVIEAEREDQQHDERRRTPRRLVMADVDVLTDEGQPVAAGDIVNMSLSGLQVITPKPLNALKPLRIAFCRSGHAPITLTGQVCWSRPVPGGHVHGIELIDTPADSQAALRDILRVTE